MGLKNDECTAYSGIREKRDLKGSPSATGIQQQDAVESRFCVLGKY